MQTVDLIFNYGGEWVRDPKLKYDKKLVHTWKGYDPDHLSFIDIVDEFCTKLDFIGVQQLIVLTPSGSYYEIEGDNGIRCLLGMVSADFNIIDLYVVDECELAVTVPNIVEHVHDTSSPISGQNLDNVSQVFDYHLEDLNDHDQEVIPQLNGHDQEVNPQVNYHDQGTHVLAQVGTDCSSSDGESDVESDESDYDSEELESIASQRKVAITDKLLDYLELDEHMTFKNIAEARKYMNLYAMANKKELILLKSDTKRLRYECQRGCPFVCLISREGDCPGVTFKTLNSEHDCPIAYNNKRVDYFTIAHYFKRKIQEYPKYKIKDMRADLKAAFELNASHGKCKRAKQLILEKLHGSFKDEYNKLEAYANELRLSNPGSDIVVNLSKDAAAEGRRRFLRMYICFQAMENGFKDGLRPFIGLDGTYLRGKAKGQILVAIGQDSMNHFYPIAWAVVDRETKVTWNWFLACLKSSLDLNMGEGYTFMSDMQKGLHVAMRDVLPQAKHRFCVRHIEANWCKRWRSKEMKKLLWWCAWATYEEDFHDQLGEIGKLERAAAEDLVTYPVQSWCRAYFDTVCKNMGVDNNFTESFNVWILDARYKPIIKMLEEIRVKVMKMVSEREAEVRLWKEEISTQCKDLFDDYLKIAHKCEVNFNGDNGYEVTEEGDTHTVHLGKRECSCRTWNLSGIPCAHAIKAMLHRRINPISAVHWWYSKEAFLKTYSHKLEPVRGEKFWKVLPSQAMEPPQLINQAGRPRTKRVREKDEARKRAGEWSASRKGRVMNCRNCGQPNHNAKGCKMNSKGKLPMEQPGKKPRKRPAKKRRSLVDEDIEEQMSQEIHFSSFPEESQVSPYVVKPMPPVQNQGTSSSNPMPIVQIQGTSSSNPSQESISSTFADFDFPYFADEDVPAVRPKVVSESKTRLHARQLPTKPLGKRAISFKGDQSGAYEPSNMPFSSPGLKWNGKKAMSTLQLQMQAKLTLDKFKGRK